MSDDETNFESGNLKTFDAVCINQATDEIYQFTKIYTRDKLRILLTLDMDKIRARGSTSTGSLPPGTTSFPARCGTNRSRSRSRGTWSRARPTSLPSARTMLHLQEESGNRSRS